MSSALVTSGLTWEEFLALPDDPRYRHAELVDGDLVLVNPPSWLHQHVVAALCAMIWNWTRAGSGRGTVTMEPPVQIAARRGYCPDVAWYRAGRGRPALGNPYLTGAPDLAIEVLSDSTRAFDLLRKRTDYARVGVGELWLIDPQGPSALVLRHPAEPTTPAEYVLVEELGAGGALASPSLPGLSIPLADLGAGTES
ncbi:MAG: Uma2 family endonuclease [Pseudonocardia sp.]